MRKLLAAFFVLFAWSAAAQPLVGPVPQPLQFAAAIYTEATKPIVSPGQSGTIAYISDCPNGNQVLPGTGCLAYVDSTGTWVDINTPPNESMAIGGQTLFLGDSTTNQGNGPKIQLATGSFVAGHAIVYDANGNAVDSGGTAQGGGTVSTANGGLLATYGSTGSVVTGLATINNGVVMTDGAGNATISTTLPSGLIILTPKIQLPSVAFNSLPGVTAGNVGQTQFVSDCQNGSEGVGAGTGCLAVVNTAGTWNRIPSPPNLTITVGGQALFLGGSTTNQGNGPKIQLASGATVNGHCPQYDAGGSLVDSGSACSGGGGSGTVAAALTNQLAYYPSSAAAVAGLATANSAVLVTNSSGVPGLGTTLPSGLTIPAPTISGPTLTGSTGAGSVILTGKLTEAASIGGGANDNMPQGTAPTSPANGDRWMTSAGQFYRANGITFGPLIGTAQLSVSGPLVYNNSTGAFSGPTNIVGASWSQSTAYTAGNSRNNNGNLYTETVASCTSLGTGTGPSGTGSGITDNTCSWNFVSTPPGTVLSGTAPITVNNGTVSLGQIKGVAFIQWDASTTVTNDTRDLIPGWQTWTAGAIQAIHYRTGGTNTPSFIAGLLINGVPVTGCTAIPVSSSSNTDANCTAANTFSTGQSVQLVITGVAGSPELAEVGITFTHTPS